MPSRAGKQCFMAKASRVSVIRGRRIVYDAIDIGVSDTLQHLWMIWETSQDACRNGSAVEARIEDRNERA